MQDNAKTSRQQRVAYPAAGLSFMAAALLWVPTPSLSVALAVSLAVSLAVLLSFWVAVVRRSRDVLLWAAYLIPLGTLSFGDLSYVAVGLAAFLFSVVSSNVALFDKEDRLRFGRELCHRSSST